MNTDSKVSSNAPKAQSSTMEKREGPALPQGAPRRNGVIPFQMAPSVSLAAPLDHPAPPQGRPRRNGVIPFQMLPPASSATHLSTSARPEEQKRLGGPSPGVTPKTASAATVDTTEPAPKKRLCGPSPFATLGTAPRQGGRASLSTPSSTTDNQGPPHGITPLVGPVTAQPSSSLMGPAIAQSPSSLMGPATAQTPSFGSSNIRNERIVQPRRSETGPSEAVPISIVPISQQLQQSQRETSAPDNKLAGAKKTIAGQKIKKAGSKRKESATEPRIHYVVPRKSARYRDPQEIAKLSVNFDFLEARYRDANRTLKEAEGDTTALFQWHGEYGRDVEAWTALSDLVEEVGDKNLRGRHVNGRNNVIELLTKESELLGKALLTGRQKQAQPGMPPAKQAREVKTCSLAPTKAAGRTARPPPPSQPQAGQDSGEEPSAGGSEANEATTQGEPTKADNDSDGALIPAPVTAIQESLEAGSSVLVVEATPQVVLTTPNNDSDGAPTPAPVPAIQESLEAGSSMDGVEPTSAVLQELLTIAPTVPQQVEEDDMMLDPADNQMAELSQPQDGSQSGEDLPLPEGDMELDATKEYLKALWTPIHESVIVQQYPQAPQAVLCAPAVSQPTQNAVEYEYPWPAHPQGEKRMGPAEWNEWTERKQRVTRAMVVNAGSELLARIDKSQPTPPTAQVAEETVRKADSLLLAQDESVRDRPVQSIRMPAPASPVPEVHIESIQTKEASAPEVGSQSAVLQPTPSAPETSDQVPLEAAMSVPAVPQPALAAKPRQVRFATGPMEVPIQATVSEPAGRMPARTVLEVKKVATEVVVSGPAVLQRVPATSEPSAQAVTSPVTQPTPVVMDSTEKVATEAVVSGPALSQQDPAALEPSPSEDNDSSWSDEEWWSALESQAPSESGRDSPMPIMPGSYVFDMLDEVVRAPASPELVPTRSKSTSPMLTEEVPKKLAASRPGRKESDSTWLIVDKPTHGSLRTATRSHLEVLLAQHEERRRADAALMSFLRWLQVTATSRVSISSQVASLQDASATETARAGVSNGTEGVENADSPAMDSDEQAAGEQRDSSGGREAASGQKPGDHTRTQPTATASEAAMQEGSALLRRLWAGARWLAFTVCALMILVLCSFPMWAKYPGHLRHLTRHPPSAFTIRRGLVAPGDHWVPASGAGQSQGSTDNSPAPGGPPRSTNAIPRERVHLFRHLGGLPHQHWGFHQGRSPGCTMLYQLLGVHHGPPTPSPGSWSISSDISAACPTNTGDFTRAGRRDAPCSTSSWGTTWRSSRDVPWELANFLWRLDGLPYHHW
ncbi:hypothetical protein N7535_003386 [Penicillium sp. DV-2018c]|nr:hypothetical protein N7535_003386 [Penicillium sp. DV-2018c]